MSGLLEMLNPQLRQVFRARKRSRDGHSLAPRYRNCLHNRRNRRFLGGQDRVQLCSSSSHTLTAVSTSTSMPKQKPKPKPRPRTRTKPTQTTVNRHRQCGLPVGNRSIVPLLHIWLRLNHSSYSMRETRSHYRKRIRLEQRSLPQNICQFIAVYCSSFYRLFVSAPSSPLAAIDAKTKRDASVVVKQKNEPPGATASPRFLNRIFGSISAMVERSLIAGAGSSPKYKYKSAAMEVINLCDILENLNSAIIDYLVDNECEEYLITPVQSMSILSTLNAY